MMSRRKPDLPELDLKQFQEELQERLSRYLPQENSEGAFPLSEDSIPEDSTASNLPSSLYRHLHEHYLELRRWNSRLSLIGPGTVDEVLSRHYAESLAGLPLIRSADRKIVDIGSGGGFPGFALAAALPSAETTLIEPRQKKWAFLNAAIRRSGLSCRCLDVRVDVPLPAGFPEDIDLITTRALTIPSPVLEVIAENSPGVRFLFWAGEKDPNIPSFLQIRRKIRLPGSEKRRIIEISSTS